MEQELAAFDEMGWPLYWIQAPSFWGKKEGRPFGEERRGYKIETSYAPQRRESFAELGHTPELATAK